MSGHAPTRLTDPELRDLLEAAAAKGRIHIILSSTGAEDPGLGNFASTLGGTMGNARKHEIIR
jgi:hypothetical protein